MTSGYTFAPQKILFDVTIAAFGSAPDPVFEKEDVEFSLTNAKNEPVAYEVAWFLNDSGQWVARVSANVTAIDTYTLKAIAPGVAVQSATHTVGEANLADVEFELASDTCEKGKLPVVESAKLGDVDITKQLVELINAGEVDIELKDASGNAKLPSECVPGTTYYAYLKDQTSAIFTGFTVSNRQAFECVEATDTSASEKAFENAVALEGVDQDGKAVKADAKGKFSVVADGKNALYVIPTSVMPDGGKNAVEVELAYEGGIAKNVFTDNDGTNTPGDLKVAGDYYVAVKAKDADSVYAGAVCYVPLTVKAYAFDEVVAFNADVDNDNAKDAELDLDNTTFVFDNAAQFVRIAVDGEDVTDKLSDVTLYAADGRTLDSGASFTNIGKKKYSAAGTYTIAGKIGSIPVKATFTVEKLDLANAVVTAEELASGTASYDAAKGGIKINGQSIAAFEQGAIVDYDSDKKDAFVFSVSPAITGVGAYKATVTAPKDDPNVTGTKTVEFNVVKEQVSGKLRMTYDGDYFATIKTFETSGAKAFDASKLGLEMNTAATGTKYVELESDEYAVTITDSKGKVVDGDYKVGETYTATARLIPDAEFSMGGTATFSFKVENGTIMASDVSITYKGDVVSSTVVSPYTGKDVTSDIEIVIKDGKKTLVEGTDYELVLENKAGERVDGAVAAGEYTLAIEGIGYNVDPGVPSIKIVVGDMQVTALRVQPSDMGVIAWTGEAVTPVIEYTLDSQAKIDAGTAEWTVLPSDYYVAKYVDEDGEAVSEVVDEGDYKVTVTPSTKIENMTLPAENVLEFTVSKTVAGFVDVSTSAWYANVVAKANTLEYMTGISGTAMFAPNATITRAEVAEVFAKMAGLELDKDKTYPTKFADVASDAWFAQSVAWASQAGIVGGYEGTDLFGSFDNATREQVATMIYRYAAVAGLDTSVEDEAKALSAYADADQLTFGKAAMAWCVEQGIMGVDTDSLNPLANMSRAEMAATAVRVQPEKIA